MLFYICDKNVLRTKSTLACFTLSWPYGSHALNSTLQKKKIQLTETDIRVLQVARPVKDLACTEKSGDVYPEEGKT